MQKRPLSVTVVAWIYVLTGAVGFAVHLAEFRTTQISETAWLEAVRLLAVAAGVFMLRGCNWARWLALAWIGFHVILSALHTVFEMAMHLLFCIIIAYVLLRPAAQTYFRAPGRSNVE